MTLERAVEEFDKEDIIIMLGMSREDLEREQELHRGTMGIMSACATAKRGLPIVIKSGVFWQNTTAPRDRNTKTHVSFIASVPSTTCILVAAANGVTRFTLVKTEPERKSVPNTSSTYLGMSNCWQHFLR
jgi:hypothetical protein